MISRKSLGIFILLLIGGVFLLVREGKAPGDDIFSKKEIFYASDSRTIQGFLYKPAGENLPAILYLHSGTSGFTADWYVRKAAERGYVVLAIHYPGEGKSEGSLGDPMQENAAALDALSYLKDLSYVNPEKIGILGSSHGAGIALKTLESVTVQAAVDVYGGTDARAVCAYWEKNHLMNTVPGACAKITSEYFDARSVSEPISITTPLLIIHGAKDTVVPVEQSDRLAAMLKKAGRTYRYMRYPDAGHELIYGQTPADLDANREIIAWFEKYLK